MYRMVPKVSNLRFNIKSYLKPLIMLYFVHQI